MKAEGRRLAEEARGGAVLAVHPSYLRVFLTFARNSLVRDMTFRMNFIIEGVTSVSWMAMNLGYYLLIFQFTDSIGENSG